jgi:DNA-3-methyladenine glycosylase I
MIAHKGKICGCIENAKKFESLVTEFGSIAGFIESHQPAKSFENLLLLKESLEATFSYLGGITVYHFMTDIGLPVLKPDRVICRIFQRLGLLENDKQLLKAVLHGRKFAEFAGVPIRYIDIVLVAYGQERSDEFGIEEGLCLTSPRCKVCSIRNHCNFQPKPAPITSAL